MKTLKFRLKDKCAKSMRNMSCEVNQIWNFCNEVSYKAIRPFHGKGKFLSKFDLSNLLAGCSKEMAVHSQTVQAIAEEYATRRKQFKKIKLNWRVSNPKSTKYSLGWIPFKSSAIKIQNGQIKYAGQFFGFWDSYGLSEKEFSDKYAIKTGSFTEDSRGRWYVNFVVDEKEPAAQSAAAKSTAIDLGWKDAATTSDGEQLHGRWYRALEQKLAVAQRANDKDRVKAIHAKISNQRKDAIHKFSTKLVRENGAIFVGNVSSAAMVKMNGKSTLDAGWGMLKTILEYKCQAAGVVFDEVNEKYTTQTCSCCKVISDSSPKGRAGLRIREWTCSECGAVHDRDINAARNILAVGHDRHAGGIPFLSA